MAIARRPLTAAEQERIGSYKEAGWRLKEIAAELHCSISTARKHWRRQRDKQAVPPRGRPRSGTLSSYAAEMVEEAVKMKQEHPGWGAVTVRLKLAAKLGKPLEELPSRSRLAALFKERYRQAVQERSKRSDPDKPRPAVARPHQRWQMDAQEGLSVGSGEKVTLLNVRDPRGLMIGSKAFLTTTPKRWRKITLRKVQATLREAFCAWGLPEEIQTDQETVSVGSGDENYPSLFTLWLAGLGIRHLASRPARPTDQGAVEREHRTIFDLAKARPSPTWRACRIPSMKRARFITRRIRLKPPTVMVSRLCKFTRLPEAADAPLLQARNGCSSTWNAPIAS